MVTNLYTVPSPLPAVKKTNFIGQEYESMSIIWFCHSDFCLLLLSVIFSFAVFTPSSLPLALSLLHSPQQSAFCSVHFNSVSVLLSLCLTLLALYVYVSLSCFCQKEMTLLLKILVDGVIAQHICLLQTILFFSLPHFLVSYNGMQKKMYLEMKSAHYWRKIQWQADSVEYR